MYSLWILTATIVIWRLHTVFSHLSKVPKQVPWAYRSKFTPYLFSQLYGILNTPPAINQGYQKYSKNDALCAITFPFSRPEILIPRKLIRWATSQPDKILSPTPVQHEIVAAKYAFLNSSVEKDFAVIYDVLRVQMNRCLPKLIPQIMDELASRIDETFGMDTEWKEVQVFLLVREVISRVTARLIMGSTVCNDKELVDNVSNFSSSVLPSAMAISLFPPFMHPFISRLTSVFNHIYMRRALKTLRPYLKQRIEAVRNDVAQGSKSLPRDDVMTWHIEEALRKKEPEEGLEDQIACRAFATMFAALESTTLTMTHALFNLCATDDPKETWEALAEEGRQVFSSEVDQASVNSLSRADSAVKETLRLNTAIKALSVQVMVADGVSLDQHNLKLPQGSRVSVSAWGIHHDEDIYPNAYTFDAFRFSRPHENGTLAEDKKEAHLLVSPSEDYLAFGFGRHACPGRYFAAVETKLFLAYMAVHYDLKQVHKRPGFVTFGHLPTPPIKGRLKIRRKRDIHQPYRGDSAML
ncbi:hypothetical protein CEP54_002755 [Fusarium duplospermum]|uniref:Cytochrome P450 n=1 Tax=Fusarium duplospermum TaxID=1325734 RepID=A0A428QTR6_9HYPO|nr:hypothetical protein CEP54_002755 [Fusarium duplospermum]